VPRYPVGRVNGDLGRRQLEDQPSVSGIHVREPQDVGDKGPIRLGVLAVKDHMRAAEHGQQCLAKTLPRKPEPSDG
jgi:hypothetical protein